MVKTKSLSLFALSILTVVLLVGFASAVVTLDPITTYTIPSSVDHGDSSFTISFDLNNTGTAGTIDFSASTTTTETSISFSTTSIVAGVQTFTATISYPDNFTGSVISGIIDADAQQTLPFSVNVDKPTDVQSCFTTGNPGNLEVRSIDIQNNGMEYMSLGDDNEWFPFEDITVNIEIRNKGNERIDNIEVLWGVWDTDRNEWVIEPDDLKDFDLKDGKTEDGLTVSFKIDDRMDLDLQDLTDGNNYRFYVIAEGTVDDGSDTPSCVSDFETTSIIIESDFVIVDSLNIPETLQCGSTVEITGEVWNIGDNDQDEVSVRVFGRETALGFSNSFEVGDIDAFDNQRLSFILPIPKNIEAKTYALEFQVYDEDGDLYQNDLNDDDSKFTVPLSVGGCVGAEGAVTISPSLESEAVAGKDLLVRATITNNLNEVKIFTVSASGFEQFADAVSLDKSNVVLAGGVSDQVLLTLNVKSSASGDYTFSIDTTSSDGSVERQPVKVSIEPRAGFLPGDNWPLYGLGLLNIILVIVIVIVAVRVARR